MSVIKIMITVATVIVMVSSMSTVCSGFRISKDSYRFMILYILLNFFMFIVSSLWLYCLWLI